MSRQINRRTALKLSGSAGIVSLAGCTEIMGGSGASGDSPSRWKLGTSSEGSGSFQIGSTMAEYFKREKLTDSFVIDPVVTAGTTATYRRVAQGEMDMGGSNTYLLESSPGSGPFSDSALPQDGFGKIRQIRGYMAPTLFCAIKRDSGISSWDDLKGKRVFVSSPGSGARSIAEEIIEQEVGLDNIKPVYDDYGSIPQMLRGDNIVAALVYNVNKTIPTGFVSEMDSTIDWKPLPYSDDVVETLQDRPYISLANVDTGWSKKVSQSFNSALIGYMYVAFNEVDTDAVYRFTKLTHEHGDELAKQAKIMSFFPDPDDFMSTLHSEIPVHQGAYQYYTEAGLWEGQDLTPPPEAEN